MLNVDLLRYVDRWIGTPLCLLLTVARYIAKPFCRRKNLPLPKKVLVIKLSEMGSTVLAYPAIAEMKMTFPDVEMFFLVLENNRAILDALKLTKDENIVSVDASSIRSLLSTAMDAVRDLRAEGIDTTIDMDFFSRFSAVAGFLVCRGNRVGFHRFRNEGLNRGRLLTHEVLYSAHVHTSVAFMALVRAVLNPDIEGGPACREKIDASGFPVPVHNVEKRDVDSVMAKLKDMCRDVGRKGMRIVLVNPNSSDLFPLRRWPLNNFIRLCSRLLSSRDDTCVVITGMESERQDAEKIMESVRYPRCVSMVGMTTFPELLALYSISSVMVTNDSGPAHFAVLCRLPTVVLFGPETPLLYGPMGSESKCLYAGYACSPCVSVNNAKASPCRRSLCLEAISVEEVLRCANQVLDNMPGRNSNQVL